MTNFEQDFQAGRNTMDSLQAEMARSVYLPESDLLVAVGAVCLELPVIFEADPGLGKTIISKSFAAAMGGRYGRHQGTQDKSPSDITGSETYDPSTGKFNFHEGPVFSNVLLADEINRNQPKAQSALLEAMQEYQVTVGGNTYQLPRPFVVLATQNPNEFAEGTYPLTKANLDRFAIGLTLPALTADERIAIRGIVRRKYLTQQVVEPADILRTRDIIAEMPETAEMYGRVNQIIDGVVGSGKIRVSESVLAGERAFGHIIDVAKSQAMIAGTKNVANEHIDIAASVVLPHRMQMTFEAEEQAIAAKDLVKDIATNLWV